MTTVLLYAEGHRRSETVCVGELLDAQPDLTTRYAGTRPYKVGIIAIRADDLVALEVAGFPERTFWVVIDDEYLRVQTAGASLAAGGGMLVVDQSTNNLHITAYLGQPMVPAALRIVEPSPPRPTAEWIQAETERALRDWQAEQDMAVAVDATFVERGIEFPA